MNVHVPSPTKSPSARSDNPPGPSLRVDVNRHRNVYGSPPLVHASTTLPPPLESPSSTTRTSRYTAGHQRGRSRASRSTSATSSALACRRQRLMKWYSLLTFSAVVVAAVAVAPAGARFLTRAIDPTGL